METIQDGYEEAIWDAELSTLSFHHLRIVPEVEDMKALLLEYEEVQEYFLAFLLCRVLDFDEHVSTLARLSMFFSISPVY